MKIVSSDPSVLDKVHEDLLIRNIKVEKVSKDIANSMGTTTTAISIAEKVLNNFSNFYNYLKELNNNEISVELKNGRIISYSEYKDLSEEELKTIFYEEAVKVHIKKPKEYNNKFQENYDKLLKELQYIESGKCNLILHTQKKQKEFKVYKNNNKSLVFLAGEEKTKMSVSKEKLFDIAFKNVDYRYKSYTSVIIEKLLDNSIFDFISNSEEIKTKTSKIAFICSGKADRLLFLENSRDLISKTLNKSGWIIINMLLLDIDTLSNEIQKFKQDNIDEFIFFYTGTGSISNGKRDFKLQLNSSDVSIINVLDSIKTNINPKKQAIILDISYGGRINDIQLDSNTEFLFSSKEMQKSYENSELKSSFFSYYFSKAIEEADSIITLSEIAEYIRLKNDKQTPVYISSRNNKPIFVNQNFNHTEIVLNPLSFKIKCKSDINPILGVKTVSKTLASIIINQPDDSGMMIGIFGKWGRGKTYLAEQTWKELKKEKSKYKRVVFSAWKYQDTKSSWAYLYENFINEYLAKNQEDSFWDKVKNYFCKAKKIWKLNLEKHTWFPIISRV